MPNKRKADYLALTLGPGEISLQKKILADAVANKGINPNLVSLKHSGGSCYITLTNGTVSHTGTGSSKKEAMADAADQF